MIDYEAIMNEDVNFRRFKTLADQIGYYCEATPDGGIELSEPDTDCPVIKVYTEYQEMENSSIHTYTCGVTFPSFSTEDFTYADDLEYVMQKWADVAKLVTALQKLSIEFPAY